jgi:hypothetical protein
MLLGKLYVASGSNRNLQNAGPTCLMQRKIVLLGMCIILLENVMKIMSEEYQTKNVITKLEQICKSCIIINNGIDCPFYEDCIREIKTGVCV